MTQEGLSQWNTRRRASEYSKTRIVLTLPNSHPFRLPTRMWAATNTEATIWPKYQSCSGMKLPWLLPLGERWLEPGASIYLVLSPMSGLEPSLSYSELNILYEFWARQDGALQDSIFLSILTAKQELNSRMHFGFYYAVFQLMCFQWLSIFKFWPPCPPSKAPDSLSTTAQSAPCQADEHSDSKASTLFFSLPIATGLEGIFFYSESLWAQEMQTTFAIRPSQILTTE